MKKTWIYLGVIAVAILLIALIFINYKTETSGELKEACIGKSCFRINISDSPEERAKGLMFAESMKENEGMLFIFDEEGKYNFWMKNTLIPLDIIWISKDMKIIDIKQGQPGNETALIPKDKAMYVLEINSGFNFSVGDEVNFR